MDITFVYHTLVSMVLFFSFAVILGDIKGVFVAVMIIGLFKEFIDPVFTISDMVGNVLGAGLAFFFVLFLTDVTKRSRKIRRK